MLPVADMSVKKHQLASRRRTGEEQQRRANSRETGGQLLDGNRIFYRIFHRVISPCTRIQR